MKRYPVYKDSGIDWLGEIPEHWEIKKVKYMTNILRGKFTHRPRNDPRMYDGKYPFIQTGDVASANKYVTKYYQTLNEEGFAVSKQFPKGTLVMTIAANVGDIAILDFEACFPDSIVGFVPKEFINLDYLYNLFIAMRQELFRIAPINTQLNLNVERIGALLAIVPTLSEQKQIAHFIDRKLEEIDHFIRNKQRLIELLNEQKTAIVNRAVTKGINPNAPMKHSGIEWLGEIPAHWEVRRLRYVGSCQNGISKGADYFGFGYPFVNYTDVYANFELPKMVMVLANSTDIDRIMYSVKEGDIFFTRTSETIEEIGITSTCLSSLENATFSGFLIRVRPFANLILPGFSKYYFRCQLHRLFFVKEMNLVTRASLSQDLLKKLPVLLPPLPEQKAIASFIEEKSAKIDKAIAKAEREIELIQEYRTTLISDAVTGKIDVRPNATLETIFTA